MWAGISGSAVGSVGTGGGSMSSTSISVRVYPWIHLISNVGVVWAGSGGGSVSRSGTGLMLGSEASGGVRVAVASEASGTSVTVRIDTGIELVGNVRVVRASGIGGGGVVVRRVGRGVHEVVGGRHDCGIGYSYRV